MPLKECGLDEGEERYVMTKRLLFAIVSAALLIVATSGCNTVRGAGEDIESVGSAIAGD